MNKRDLVEKISQEAHLTKIQATKALDVLLDAVQSGLTRGDRVTLMGFGSFAVSKRKARRVRDPRRGIPIQIEARRVARFTPGLELKAAVGKLDGESPAV